MLTLGKVAITGGLACGKTTVCSLLKDMGAYVVSSDEIVHKLLSPDNNIGKKIIDLLGLDIIVDNQIDRNKISQKVFQDKNLLKKLEELIHPSVQEEIDSQYLKVQKEGKARLFVAEVPLLLEAGLEPYYDAVVVVVAKADTCKARFMGKTGSDTSEYEKRSQFQWTIQEKQAKADYIIFNQGSFEELKVEVEKLFNQLTH